MRADRWIAELARVARGPSMNGVPVLVVGSGITALGAQRALHSAGIASYLLVDEPGDLAALSRWYRAPAGGTDSAAQPLAARLDAVRLDRAMLMPCADRHALSAADLPESLRTRFATSLASLDTLATCIDKGKFAAVLAAADVPHPHTVATASPSVLRSLPDSLFARSFLKPRDSQRFFGRFGVKAFAVASRSEAIGRLETLTAEGFEMMFQEYVPGPPANHFFVDGFCDRDHKPRAVFVRQRLRMYPPDFGNSTYMVSVDPGEAAAAVDSVRRLLEALRYRGIFSAELKRDARDGVFRMLELNVRPWWYVEFAARCGVNVCAMAYRDALGMDVGAVTSYDVGRTCVYPYYDFFACRAQWHAGSLSLGAWLRSWMVATQPVLTWKDPLPGLRAGARVLGGWLWRMVPRGSRTRAAA